MAYVTVNEGSTSYLTIMFKDKNGDPAEPTSATYRIDCKTTGTAMKAETEIESIAASVEIMIASSENKINTQSNDRELRVVTVTATYGADDKVSDEYYYYVKNLYKVT